MLVAQPGRLPVHVRQPKRLWRKNLRDNDGNGTIDDRRRRRPEPELPRALELRRGGLVRRPVERDLSRHRRRRPSPRRRPSQGLLDRIGFSFQVNYHSYGPWLLYPEGWQIGRRRRADDPIYFALSGNLDNPAIDGLRPGPQLGRPLRDERRDDRLRARRTRGTLAWTPELDRGLRRLRLRLPGRRGARPGGVREEPPVRARRRQVGEGPRRPGVAPGHRDEALLPEERRHLQGGHARSPTSRSTSPTATRSRCACSPSGASATSSSSTGSTAARSAPSDTREWRGGETLRRARPTSTTTSCRAWSAGTKPGDSVEVWFESQEGEERLVHLHGRGRVEATRSSSSRPRTTPAPRRRPRPTGPHYLSYYEDALAANGIGYDVYDVDANGRKAPDRPRRPLPLRRRRLVHGRRHHHAGARLAGGNASRLANDEMLDVRDVPERGRQGCSTPASTPASSTRRTRDAALRPDGANEQCVTPTRPIRRSLPRPDGSG